MKNILKTAIAASVAILATVGTANAIDANHDFIKGLGVMEAMDANCHKYVELIDRSSQKVLDGYLEKAMWETMTPEELAARAEGLDAVNNFYDYGVSTPEAKKLGYKRSKEIVCSVLVLQYIDSYRMKDEK